MHTMCATRASGGSGQSAKKQFSSTCTRHEPRIRIRVRVRGRDRIEVRVRVRGRVRVLGSGLGFQVSE